MVNKPQTSKTAFKKSSSSSQACSSSSTQTSSASSQSSKSSIIRSLPIRSKIVLGIDNRYEIIDCDCINRLFF